MSDDDSKPPTTAQRQYLSQSIAALLVAIDELHESMTRAGRPEDGVQAQLQSELATVIVQLRQYRDRSGVDYASATTFETPDALLSHIMEGDVAAHEPRDAMDAEPQAKPAPARVPVGELYQSALDIIDLCNDLGLSPQIDESNELVDVEADF